jgi:hypothetical protein
MHMIGPMRVLGFALVGLLLATPAFAADPPAKPAPKAAPAKPASKPGA